ncbi:ATP-binding cassette domain-containing protein [Heliobacterium undosum]|uniref:ATP-binding cassette domain-containing protein n=1 Tax=Heliomicrobium undosum TaxID=121734 RepID=A0A845KZL0_9FIRM|nr:ABC transporter ATP-binding protein [Heliomicrobium undosum]MZP29223.1 ATP-binding cassette domain-containing protein [Heliomicrobium undosum]
MTEPIRQLEMRDITKRFPGVLSNDRVNIEVRAGEVLALLGENGAGKTTLMNVLYGLYAPEEGQILLNGRPVTIGSPKKAIELGIGMVHQHFMLVPTLTVAENVALGLEGQGIFLKLNDVSDRIRAISAEYGITVNPDAYVWQLSVGEQQRVEIVKALFRGASLLILDEPTAVLTPQEAEELVKVLRRMAERGGALIIISHKLHEVMAVSDRVTVLRDGRVAATLRTADTSPEELAQQMVGREMHVWERQPAKAVGQALLELRNLTATSDKGTPALRGVDLNIRAGEIVGIAGVSGNGQKELAEVIAGLRAVTGGEVLLKGRNVANCSPREILKAGLGYVPEDRLHVGTIPSFSNWENLILKDHGDAPYARRFMLQGKTIREICGRLIGDYGVKTPDQDTWTGRLSGGNIQRLILAREITREPAVLVAAYPTRGLDIGATEYVHTKLMEIRDKGMGILLISEDLEELMNLSDRIAVLYEGRLVAVMDGAEADENRLGLLMAGMEATAGLQSA